MTETFCMNCGHKGTLHVAPECFGVVTTPDSVVECDCDAFEPVNVDLMYASLSVLDERVFV